MKIALWIAKIALKKKRKLSQNTMACMLVCLLHQSEVKIITLKVSFAFLIRMSTFHNLSEILLPHLICSLLYCLLGWIIDLQNRCFGLIGQNLQVFQSLGLAQLRSAKSKQKFFCGNYYANGRISWGQPVSGSASRRRKWTFCKSHTGVM